ncbi:hypothetical protein BCR36DRAFT_416224 [Piromyces finnis]|uniref:Glycosyltransferase family 17 protein n=1 Tax=Piromyces finnis TaxID=1754191 RepID=A0A1Y1UX47_9FUNG|nr:hypothetical protein BCR36DRAFT_416224 [Piromyces finnis]|eukprot:ORX42214.1 hypothetical protein BCR36DRAFT_416224 [Piromyces finnis]
MKYISKNEEYILINDTDDKTPFLEKKNKNKENVKFIDEENGFVFSKGKPRIDKYGIDLNAYILQGIYSIGFDEDPYKKIEDWSLYTPPCPNMKPVIHSDYVMNPDCESSSLQFYNYNNYKMPVSLRLNSISNQIEKFKEWKKNNNTNPYYGDQNYKQLLSDEYHPYDYGYKEDNTNNDVDDVEYYNKLVKSRMDEVPDPRRRRLFSFILFNTEFDLLDLYLSEYYNIVDYFVIYEANSTFSGHPKPLYFTRTLLETDRYDKYKDKLIPLPCEIIVNEDNGRGTGFPKEHLARRAVIEKGLMSVQARHGDIFMHGDLDEMAKPHILTRLKKCGGWEHLQAGIGGGPKSFKYENAETYLNNDNMNIEMTQKGEYNIDYTNEITLGFLSWFYDENSRKGTVCHPNIVIFDARRSLGQLNDYDNYHSHNITKEKRSNNDPLLDPNFNPYQGYTYSVHHTDKKIGKGFLAETIRFDTSKIRDMEKNDRPMLWNGGWHMSSFLPTIDQFYNKIKSYSHYDTFSGNEEKDKKKIISRIKQHLYIFGKSKKYYDNKPLLPTSYINGYDYNFNYTFWKDNSRNYTKNKKFVKYVRDLEKEIPAHVWKNPICYSYMLDRDYGFEKKLWWQEVPKESWNTINIETLSPSILKKITPKIISKEFQTEMFDTMSKENNL